MSCFSQVSAISRLANSALSRGATIQPTTYRLKTRSVVLPAWDLEELAGPVSTPPAPSPCPDGVQPRILGCATPRQPRCPPAHGNRTGGRTATKATGLRTPPQKNKNTERVCGDPLPTLPVSL